MTRRERIERRIGRRQAWAEVRDARAAAALTRAHAATEHIPSGQPVLVGHHSEARHRQALRRREEAIRAAIDSQQIAELHRQRAANLQQALNAAVFNDDPNACEALEARIAAREAEAARIQAYNDSCRSAAKLGGQGDLSLLDDRQRGGVRLCAAAGQLRPGGALPPYALSNLRAVINADRRRLELLRRSRSK